MIHETHRFHGRGSLRFVYSRGKVVRGSYGSLKYVMNFKRQTYRASVVVSRKVHKSAVVRNRIRRRVYEAIRAEEANIHGPYDIAFIAYSDQLASIPHKELCGQIHSQLRAAGIVSPEGAGGRGIVDQKERST